MCVDVCGDCAGAGAGAGEEVIIKGDKIDNATGAPWHSYIHYSFSVSIASKQRSR